MTDLRYGSNFGLLCANCGHGYCYHFDYDESLDRMVAHPCEHYNCNEGCKQWMLTPQELQELEPK